MRQSKQAGARLFIRSQNKQAQGYFLGPHVSSKRTSETKTKTSQKSRKIKASQNIQRKQTHPQAGYEPS
jgi:hypothetical protein